MQDVMLQIINPNENTKRSFQGIITFDPIELLHLASRKKFTSLKNINQLSIRRLISSASFE